MPLAAARASIWVKRWVGKFNLTAVVGSDFVSGVMAILRPVPS